jgi:hypothetical protein
VGQKREGIKMKQKYSEELNVINDRLKVMAKRLEIIGAERKELSALAKAIEGLNEVEALQPKRERG